MYTVKQNAPLWDAYIEKQYGRMAVRSAADTLWLNGCVDRPCLLQRCVTRAVYRTCLLVMIRAAASKDITAVIWTSRWFSVWSTGCFIQAHTMYWNILNTVIQYYIECVGFKPLTPELPQHGVPRPAAPRHNIICNSFFKISKPIFQLYRNKSKTCRLVFWPYGNL